MPALTADAAPALPGFFSHTRIMRGLQTNATVVVNAMVDSLARFANAKNMTPKMLEWAQNLGVCFIEFVTSCGITGALYLIAVFKMML